MDIEPSKKAIGVLVQEQIHEFPYDRFEAEYLRHGAVTLADYERYVRNEAGIRQLVATAAVTARFVNPQDAETLWKKEHQEIATKLAVFASSNYLSKVVITNGALEDYYSKAQVNYRLLDRTIISYIAFAASNYLADADQAMAKETNITEVINQYYNRSGTNVWKDTNGVPMAEAEAKTKIREEMRLNQARLAARRAAAEFGTELMNQTEPNKLANFETLAAAKKFTVRTTAPFDVRSGPEEFAHEQAQMNRDDEEPTRFLQTLRQKALALTDDKPILFSPIPGYDAVYIIARKAKLPSELQSFDTVKAKLTDDYKNMMAQDLARKAGQAFHTNLTNGLQLKKSFDEIATANKVMVVDVPPFSAATQTLTNLDPRINLRQLQGITANLEPGQASSFIPQMSGGWIIYLTARPPIDPKAMAAGIDEFTGTLRQYRQVEAFNSWFSRQVEKDRFKPPASKESSISAAN